MFMQLQSTSTVLSVSLEKTELLRAIKNEPLESDIGIDDIPNSLNEEIIPDLKDIDIVSHVLTEDLIKSETVSENTFENNHSGSVETQVFVKTENIPLIKTENITQSEYLYTTQDISDGNVSRGTSQGVIEVQGPNEYFDTLQSDKQFVNFFKDLSDISRKAKCPNKTDFSECYRTVETTSCEKDKKKGKVIEVPVIPTEAHKYTTLVKTKHACNKNKSTYEKNKKRYCCEKCMYTSGKSTDFKRHQLTHKTKSEIDDRLLKYRCDKCKYKTYRHNGLKVHKLIHLKPEEIQYFYCYHCSYKSKYKKNLKTHIFRHFRNAEVPFHCYICDFVMLKGDLIIEHFKKNPKHHSKCGRTDYKSQLKIPYFYCYHCFYKCKEKTSLKSHIFKHFKRREIPFHCYICDFVTLKRDLIIAHFKKHPKHHSKCDETDYKKQLETYTKYRCDKCEYKTCWRNSFKIHKLKHLKPEEIPYFYCYHCFYKCKQNLKTHIFNHFKRGEIPFHCYICDFVTLKRDLIMEHFKKHPKHHSKCDETDYKNQLETSTKKQMRYSSEKYAYASGKSSDFKFHQLTHKTKAEMMIEKYCCDKCKYETYWYTSLTIHKLKHLKPEEIPYFYCYHCFYKCKQKSSLKSHIFNHFKREEIPFHCYICDFVTLKRDLIMEHFKKHPKHHSKCDETDNKNQLEIYTKYRCDKCKYKSCWLTSFRVHKLSHLKPEEIHYFCCYHCSYKSKWKHTLKRHIFGHFKKEEIPFHCYICDFVTLKRESFKKHLKHHNKSDETEYRNQLLRFYKIL